MEENVEIKEEILDEEALAGDIELGAAEVNRKLEDFGGEE